MDTLPNGQDATLAGYRKLIAAMYGERSKAVAFLDEKIAKQGANMEVIAPLGQMMYLLTTVHLRGARPEDERIVQ